MPTTINWYDDEKTILHEKLIGNFTLDEWKKLVDEETEMCATQSHTVHVLMDFSDVGRLPANPIGGLKYAESKLAPNLGKVVLIKPGAFINVIVGMTKKLNINVGSDIDTAHTVEAAIAMIKKSESA